MVDGGLDELSPHLIIEECVLIVLTVDLRIELRVLMTDLLNDFLIAIMDPHDLASREEPLGSFDKKEGDY